MGTGVAADRRVDNKATNGDLPAAIAATMIGADPSGRAFGKLTAYTAALDLGWRVAEGVSLDWTTGFNQFKYDFFSGLDQTSFSQLAFVNVQRNRLGQPACFAAAVNSGKLSA